LVPQDKNVDFAGLEDTILTNSLPVLDPVLANSLPVLSR
jgi:hypothetical protein